MVAQWSEGGQSTRDIDVQRSAVADQVLQGAGAILGGRRWYDVAVRKFDGLRGDLRRAVDRAGVRADARATRR